MVLQEEIINDAKAVHITHCIIYDPLVSQKKMKNDNRAGQDAALEGSRRVVFHSRETKSIFSIIQNDPDPTQPLVFRIIEFSGREFMFMTMVIFHFFGILQHRSLIDDSVNSQQVLLL